MPPNVHLTPFPAQPAQVLTPLPTPPIPTPIPLAAPLISPALAEGQNRAINTAINITKEKAFMIPPQLVYY